MTKKYRSGLGEQLVAFISLHPEGVTTAQICEALGISSVSAASAIYRASKKGLVFGRGHNSARVHFPRGAGGTMTSKLRAWALRHGESLAGRAADELREILEGGGAA